MSKSLKEVIKDMNIPDEIEIREYTEEDFQEIRDLYNAEGWMTFVNRSEDAKKGWRNSAIKIVVVIDSKIIGFLRGLTDGMITTYIAEVLVDSKHRGKGIGGIMVEVCHSLYPNTRIDLLSSEDANDFYRTNNFREILGFRKSFI